MGSRSWPSKRLVAFISRHIDESERERLRESDPDMPMLLDESFPGQVIDIATESRRLLTSLPCWDDRVIDERSLQRQIPLSCDHQQAPLTGLGQLDKLSAEIVSMVVDKLDLQSLTNLKSVSRCASLFVKNNLYHQMLRKEAPNTLRVYLATGLASWITPSDLVRVLHRQDCCFCGEFAGFIYLPKCVRSCFRCLARDRRTLTLTTTEARDRLNLSDEALSTLPLMQSIPRSTFWACPQRPQRIALVDYTAAAALAARSNPAEDTDMLSPEKCKPSRQSSMLSCMRRRGKKALDRTQQVARNRDPSHATVTAHLEPSAYGSCETLNQSVPRLANHLFQADQDSTPRRFLASMRLPVIRSETAIPDFGLYCNGCKKSNVISGTHPIEQKMYSRTGIVLHLMHCPFSKALWREARSSSLVAALGYFPTNLDVKPIRQGPLPPWVLEPHYEHFFEKYSWVPTMPAELITLYFDYERRHGERSQAIKQRKDGLATNFAGCG